MIVTIDVKELGLVGWLAKKALFRLTKPSDKKLAKDALKNYAKMLKQIDSWEKK